MPSTETMPSATTNTTTMTLSLPPSTSPSLALIHPTTSEKLRQTTLNSVSWRGALSTEAYLRREAVLASQECTKDGGMTTWALVDTSLPSSQRVLLCACETYKKKGLVATRRGDGSGEVEITEVTSHGIGSVFCPPDHRGKGYAGRMMRELGKVLRKWQARNGEEVGFTVLYSDIGKQFYATHGWHPFPSAHISLPSSTPISQTQTLPPVRLLSATDLPPLCALDCQHLRQRLSTTPKGQTSIALLPDLPTIRWHHAREEFVANELFGRTPLIKGGIINAELPGQRVWCYWTRFWYNPDRTLSEGNTLNILRLVIEDEEGGTRGEYRDAVAALFVAALEQAREWGMECVEAWNPPGEVVEGVRKVLPEAEVEERDVDSIPSVMWYGLPEEKVEWVLNEKYAWC